MITDSKTIASEFCKFFSNVGISLANKIPSTNYSFKSFLKSVIKETIFLSPTCKNELYEICMTFKKGKAPGVDNIPSMHIIKNYFHSISEPLTYI